MLYQQEKDVTQKVCKMEKGRKVKEGKKRFNDYLKKRQEEHRKEEEDILKNLRNMDEIWKYMKKEEKENMWRIRQARKNGKGSLKIYYD